MNISFNFNLKWAVVAAVIGLACLTTGLTMKSCVDRKMDRYEQNIAAYQDTLRTYRLKDSSTVAAKRAFLVTQSELQAKLDEAGMQIKDLQRQLNSKVTQASNIKANIDIPEIRPVVIHDTIYDSMANQYTRETLLKHTEPNMSLDAYVKVADTVDLTLSNITIPIDLTVGQTKDNQVFVRSTNPYVKVNNITSYIQQQKKKHWGIGINVGPGVYYDPFRKQVGAGVGAQIGIQYNF